MFPRSRVLLQSKRNRKYDEKYFIGCHMTCLRICVSRQIQSILPIAEDRNRRRLTRYTEHEHDEQDGKIKKLQDRPVLGYSQPTTLQLEPSFNQFSITHR